MVSLNQVKRILWRSIELISCDGDLLNFNKNLKKIQWNLDKSISADISDEFLVEIEQNKHSSEEILQTGIGGRVISPLCEFILFASTPMSKPKNTLKN